MQIERGFQNNYGENFANIVNVGFSSLSELRDFLGKFITETKKENNNFATAKGDYDGIFLYQMPSINDDDYAYRIYRDFENDTDYEVESREDIIDILRKLDNE